MSADTLVDQTGATRASEKTPHETPVDMGYTSVIRLGDQPERDRTPECPLQVTEEAQRQRQRELRPPPLTVDELTRVIEARVQARLNERAPWQNLHETAVRRRAAEIARWPAGQPCPRWRIREAWIAHHPKHGINVAATTGTAAAGNVTTERLTAAITTYEAHPEHRPPGWPTSGPAALTVLAAIGSAHALAGDVARLTRIARDMRATAELQDPNRIARDRRRAERRHHRGQHDAPTERITFRTRTGRTETTDQMRQRQRDLLLYIGRNPALFPSLGWAEEHLLQAEASGELPPDIWPLPSAQREARQAAEQRGIAPRIALWTTEQQGITRRADRYAEELRYRHWHLPDTWPIT